MSSTLVSTQEVALHLGDPAWVVIDCRFSLGDEQAGRRAYGAGHIPGAHYAHLNEDLAAPVRPDSGRHPLPDPRALGTRLREWGVNTDSQVVVYDDAFGSMAARLWWLLRWLGHQDVALMDGVFPKWKREGRTLELAVPSTGNGNFNPRPDDSLWLSVQTLEARHADRSVLLLDARAEERFLGDREPLDTVAGHVPGAVNRPYDDNLDIAGTYLEAGELKGEYEALLKGRDPHSVVHMCGSGVTACHSVLAMETAGLSGSRLYAGSWSEWITDPRRPVAVGQ